MPRYLVKASYSPEGVQGLLKEGGSARRDALTAAVASAGGTVESLFYAFGGDDLYIVMDAPDNVSAAALGLAVAAGGAITWNTTVLLTPEEIDEAARKSVTYRPPGGVS